MTYDLRRGGNPPQHFASLAEALEASDVPASYWGASVKSHPDEIATFYGTTQTIHAQGVAAEFCEMERAAGRLPSTGATP